MDNLPSFSVRKSRIMKVSCQRKLNDHQHVLRLNLYRETKRNTLVPLICAASSVLRLLVFCARHTQSRSVAHLLASRASFAETRQREEFIQKKLKRTQGES